MIDFARMMQEMEGEKPDTRLPEAVIADLKQMYAEYSSFLNGCAFSSGDIVTPKKGYSVKGAGEPHVVLETRNAVNVQPIFLGEPASSSFGRRADIRVGSFGGDNRFARLVESWQFELFIEAERRKLAGTEEALKAA